MKMTQECIDFMAEYSLFPETKIISSLQELEEAEIVLKNGGSNSTEYRFVLDIENMILDDA